MFIVAFGDPFDGLTLYGPFWSAEDALKYAETEAKGAPFWIRELQSTNEEDI
jgi:hypothetical protein